MRIPIVLLACASAVMVSAQTMAQEATQPRSSAIITIEIVIAEFSAGGRAPPAVDLSQVEDVATKLRELEEQNAITSITRATLSTLDQKKATVQIGHRVPIRTGRVAFARRGDGGPVIQSSLEMQHVGTVFSVTPHVLDDGGLMVELQIEKSDVTHSPATHSENSDQEAEQLTERVSTLSTMSTARVPIGKFAVVSSLSETGDQESAQSVVIASARIDE